MLRHNYKFYATLLDKFDSYVNSSRIYQEFWGFSENPEKSEEEFEKEQFESLINTINRIPFDSEKADKGTAFNEVVDCLIENRKSEKMEISVVNREVKKSDATIKVVSVKYKERTFEFNLSLCQEFAKYFEGAVTQHFTEGTIHTKYGDILLYGYLDELMPFKISDIKTTSKYSAFKFRNGWQHKVYPFCLIQNGINITDFEYRVTDFKSTWSEFYAYDEQIVVPQLIAQCEALVEFVEMNKHLITDKKIFNLTETAMKDIDGEFVLASELVNENQGLQVSAFKKI